MILRRALARLTITWSVTVLLIVAVFAIAVYLFVTSTFDLDAVGSGPDAPDGGPVVDAAELGFDALRRGLAVSYAVLVVVVPVVSHLLARRALAPVRAASDAQQRFVDDASHELRTPLSVIQGELELARLRDRSAAEYREAIDSALLVVHHLTTMTGDLLLLARDGRRALAGTFRPVQLADVLDGAVAIVAPMRPALTVTVGADAVVLGSPELLTRAVANLIENAVAATPDGEAIDVAARTDGRHVVVEVRDGGIGMTPSETARAPERFWRSDGSRSTRGHGIGLALVTAIAEAHGGRLELRSAPGRGTIARLRLPRSATGRP